jgi:hypothetical protein
MGMWVFENYKGRIAVTFGWLADSEKPVEQKDLWVTRLPWENFFHGRDESIDARYLGDNVFAYDDRLSGYRCINTEGSEHITETRQIKPPRRNSKYVWEWKSGKWVKKFL